MKQGNSRKLICIFSLYGLTTLLFNAYTTGQVADESYYLNVGLAVLKLHRYNFFSDFPPLAVTMGAVLPALLNMKNALAPETLFAARIYHIFLFSIAGYNISNQILKD